MLSSAVNVQYIQVNGYNNCCVHIGPALCTCKRPSALWLQYDARLRSAVVGPFPTECFISTTTLGQLLLHCHQLLLIRGSHCNSLVSLLREGGWEGLIAVGEGGEGSETVTDSCIEREKG